MGPFDQAYRSFFLLLCHWSLNRRDPRNLQLEEVYDGQVDNRCQAENTCDPRLAWHFLTVKVTLGRNARRNDVKQVVEDWPSEHYCDLISKSVKSIRLGFRLFWLPVVAEREEIADGVGDEQDEADQDVANEDTCWKRTSFILAIRIGFPHHKGFLIEL